MDRDKQEIQKAFTQKQIENLLGVTAMTIHNWRKEGTPFPVRSIPTAGGKHKNYFLLEEVKEWLQQNRPKLLEKIQGGPSVEDRRVLGNPANIAASLSA